jgi:hypothetical protein
MVGLLMQELLRQLDPDYYRAVQLLVARAELEQLRQERSVFGEAGKWSNVPAAECSASRTPARTERNRVPFA